MNNDLRKTIIEMVYRGKDGHIPSAFSIVDIINLLYERYLHFDPQNPDSPERDYFILSKGHGCVAMYAVLHKFGFLTDEDLMMFCRKGGRLGEHPDCTKVPGVEASTGSLGHGLSFALGIALGLRLRGMNNKVFVLMGDGECHEGTVWEAASVARNFQLGNLCAVVDWNGSAAQLMPVDDLPAKWKAFGWHTQVVDGHSNTELASALDFKSEDVPNMIVAKTVKGKGVPMLEGHGMWHHRIPSAEEYTKIMEVLR
ncbi:MAG: transketolase [Candidatus Hinthialibacter antarcticus]|nr:transketolase [Candidatus Hinthialibacter antarcticus]